MLSFRSIYENAAIKKNILTMKNCFSQQNIKRKKKFIKYKKYKNQKNNNKTVSIYG